MNRKKAVALTNTLLSSLRRIPGYLNWSKDDFIKCQCAFENAVHPARKDQVGRFDVLCRFALRAGVTVPTVTIKASRGARQREPVRCKSYNQKEVFTEWRLLRYEALKKANGACECCGATPESSGQPLHVDHIKPKSIYPHLEFELLNLQVLCADCNIGKGNWDEMNWRALRQDERAQIELDGQLLNAVRVYQ